MSPSRVPRPVRSRPGMPGGPTARPAAWHGKASVWGSVCGVLGVAVVMGLPALPRAAPYVAVWGVGLVLLLVRGRVRQVGVGLLASGLLWPTLMAWGLVQNAVVGHP